MNVIAEIDRINAAELEQGVCGTSASWHATYAESAWVYVGNLPTQLTEGDVICVMSQFGEVSSLGFGGERVMADGASTTAHPVLFHFFN